MTTATTTVIPTGTWTADPAHSTIGFSVKHLGIATVRGQFTEFEGALELDEDLSGARISAFSVIGCVSPCIVNSPSILKVSSSIGVTAVDSKRSSG